MKHMMKIWNKLGIIDGVGNKNENNNWREFFLLKITKLNKMRIFREMADIKCKSGLF